MTDEKALRNAIIKLAYERPDLREHLLPLVHKEANLKALLSSAAVAALVACSPNPSNPSNPLWSNPGKDSENRILDYGRIAKQPPQGKKDLIKLVTGENFETIKEDMARRMNVDNLPYASALNEVAWEVVSKYNVNLVKKPIGKFKDRLGDFYEVEVKGQKEYIPVFANQEAIAE
jgi:hypothetical protein